MPIRTSTQTAGSQQQAAAPVYTGPVVSEPIDSNAIREVNVPVEQSTSVREIPVSEVETQQQPVSQQSQPVVPQQVQTMERQSQQPTVEERQNTQREMPVQQKARISSGLNAAAQMAAQQQQPAQQKDTEVSTVLPEVNNNLQPISSSIPSVTNRLWGPKAIQNTREGERDIRRAMRANARREKKIADKAEIEATPEKTESELLDQQAQNVTEHASDPQPIETRKIPPKVNAKFGRNSKPQLSKYKVRDSIKARFAQKVYKGTAVQGKIVGDATVGIMDVSMGSEFVSRVLAQDGNPIIKLVLDQMDQNIDPSTPEFVHEVIRVINANNFMVAVSKSPVNRPSSTQKRRLRIHYGAGIHMNPMAAKSFNADFDGDDANISFAKRTIEMARPAMAVIFDVGGEINLDVDFFHIADYNSKEMKAYFYNDILADDKITHTLLSMSDKDKLYDAVLRLGKDGKEDSFRNLIETIYEVADANVVRLAEARSKEARDYAEDVYYRRVAQIFDSIYTGSRHVVLYNAAMRADSRIFNPEDLPPVTNNYERALVDLTEEIATGILVEGKPPMNFQQFRDMFCAYVGEVDNKNIAFRFVANIAKMYRYDPRLTIGGNIDFEELYSKTCMFAMSKLISNAANVDKRVVTAKKHVREVIIRDIGLPTIKDENGNILPNPKYNGDFYQFYMAFCARYQRESFFIQACDVQATTNMGYKRNDNVSQISIGSNTYENEKGELVEIENSQLTIGDSIRAFLDIYGDYSVEEIFGPYLNWTRQDYRNIKFDKPQSNFSTNHILDKYLGESLNFFKVHNDLVGLNEGKAYSTKPLKADNGTSNRELYALNVLLSIADKRTSAATEFRREYYKQTNAKKKSVCENLADLCHGMYAYLSNNPDAEDYMYADDVFNVMFEMGPDLFVYFGMDDMQSFLHSKYGSLLMKPGITADEVASIRLAMITEYRMGRILNARDKVLEARKTGKAFKVMLEENVRTMEWDALASSSIFWEGIVKDYTNGSPAFHILQDEVRTNSGRGVVRKNAGDTYWNNPKHSNVFDVLLDTDISFELKEAIVSDVVRVTLHRWDLSSYEVAYQLEQDASATVFSDAPRTSAGVMSTARQFNDRYDSFRRKGRKNARKNIDDAYEFYHGKKNNPNDLMVFLDRIAKYPFLLTSVSSDIFADAICTSLDVSYHLSEKSRQSEWTNALYSALCFQRNGGMQNDIYRTDDRALGLLHYRNVTPSDVVRVIADPNYSITLYNDNGATCLLNQASLMNIDHEASVEEIWKWLKDNPRIASAFRLHSVSVVNSDGRTGDAYLSASDNTRNSIELINKMELKDIQRRHAEYLLMDHPTFGALVALFTPTNNRVSRLQRGRYIKTMNYLIDWLLLAAESQQKYGAALPFERDELYERLKKISDEGLPTGLRIGLQSAAPEVLNKIDELDNTSARELANIVYKYLIGYIDELAREIPDIEPVDLKDENVLINGIDKASMQAFYSVRQDLNGAKTKISTGVEGSETFQFGPWISLLNSRDNYADLQLLAGDYEGDELEFLNGMEAILPDGTHVTIDDNVEELLTQADGEDVVIKVFDDYLANRELPDQTTDSFGHQASSVSAYMIIKRDNGAEKYNLKIKKFGDDGTDSITKFSKYIQDVNYENIVADLNFIYTGTKDIDTVKFELAQRLYNANMNLDGNEIIRYDEMSLANYMCLADLMVFVNKDADGNEQVCLRSLEMMANAVKYGIPYSLVEDGSIQEMKDAAREAISQVGNTRLDSRWARSLVLQGLRVSGGQPQNATFGYKARSSSLDRNLQLMNQLVKENNVKVLGQKQYEDHYESLNKIRDIPKLKPYDVYGFIDSKNSMLKDCVGPMNAWYVFKNANKNAVNDATNRAYDLGITMIYETFSDVPTAWASEAIQFEKKWIIPFFELRLNGSEVMPTDAKFSIMRMNPDAFVTHVEDDLNEFSLGDAQVQVFKSMTDRINPAWADNEQISFEDIFPNVYRKWPNANIQVSIASKETIDTYIMNGNPVTFDYGITRNARNFNDRKKRVDNAIEKFRNAYSTIDDSGIRSWKTNDSLDAGDIVAFADATINTQDGQTFHVLAPIIPFDLKGSLSVPTRYQITGWSIMKNGIDIGWRWIGDIKNQLFKLFEGAGAANKSMFSTNDIKESPMLPCGIPVDFMVATPTTASRRAGTDRRIKTMETLMYTARAKGYNFGELEEAFPNNRDLAEQLQVQEIPMETWDEIVEDNSFVYHLDPEINAFVRMQVRQFYENGGNPSWYLASHFNSEPNNVWWEYTAMFRDSLVFENALLKFHNAMDNKLCPANIFDETSTDHDFRINHGEGFDYGCLQMEVPHSVTIDGKVVNFYRWQSVFMGLSFLGEEFSGFHKPSINGASMYLDALNAINMQGEALNDFELRQLLKWAWADTPRRGELPHRLELDLSTQPENTEEGEQEE